MNVKSTKVLFLRHLIPYKKAIMLLAVLALLAPGFLPRGFINHNQVSHAELCCCGNVVSTCRDCCCSDDHAGNDNTGKYTVTITACGGTSDDIFTTPNINYFFSHSVFINFIPVTTLAETATLQLKEVLNKPPYKPPKLQLLSNFT
jgi:hypothetical protein